MSEPAAASVQYLRSARARAQIGTVLTLPGAVSSELLAEPFDLVWIDLEHGALGRIDAQQMLLGAQAAGALAFVRVGQADASSLVGPMLDAGADGIVVADVREEAQAVWLTALTRYPPDGRRGFGPRRSALRGRTWQPDGGRQPQLWLQIESQQGVAAAEEIARTPGVDAVLVGVADLCLDLGIPVGLTDSRLQDALLVVADAATRSGVVFGLAGPLQKVGELGVVLEDTSVLVHSTDARLCAAAVDDAALTLRGVVTDARTLPGGLDG
jgi:4-hydroxy-2-oxoheptanedioate aldolase